MGLSALSGLALTGLGTRGGAAAPSTLNNDLYAYWKMENVNDSIGARHLTNVNAVTFPVGKNANAGNFVRASLQYLSLADASLGSLSPGDTTFSMSCWVYNATNGQQRSVAGVWNPTGDKREWTLFKDSTNNLSFGVSSTGANAAVVQHAVASTITAGFWYHVVFGHDAENNQLWSYVGGAANANTSHSAGIFQGNADFRMGNDQANNYWNGMIDEVGWWTRRLTLAEVTELYAAGSGKFLNAGNTF